MQIDCLFANKLPLEEFVSCDLFSEKVTSCYKRLHVPGGDMGLLSPIVVNRSNVSRGRIHHLRRQDS